MEIASIESPDGELIVTRTSERGFSIRLVGYSNETAFMNVSSRDMAAFIDLLRMNMEDA